MRKIISTKTLAASDKNHLLQAGVSLVEYDALKIETLPLLRSKGFGLETATAEPSLGITVFNFTRLKLMRCALTLLPMVAPTKNGMVLLAVRSDSGDRECTPHCWNG